MGSLTSRPKVKAQPQVVYMAAPAPAPTAAPPVTTPSGPADTGSNPPARTGAESLLLRDRGAFGTVLTGFRGLLSLADNLTPRKNLLGE